MKKSLPTQQVCGDEPYSLLLGSYFKNQCFCCWLLVARFWVSSACQQVTRNQQRATSNKTADSTVAV
jgi:hypothetical protein